MAGFVHTSIVSAVEGDREVESVIKILFLSVILYPDTHALSSVRISAPEPYTVPSFLWRLSSWTRLPKDSLFSAIWSKLNSRIVLASALKLQHFSEMKIHKYLFFSFKWIICETHFVKILIITYIHKHIPITGYLHQARRKWKYHTQLQAKVIKNPFIDINKLHININEWNH